MNGRGVYTGNQLSPVVCMPTGTAVVTVAVTALMLSHDWGSQGQDNIFSSIRPAVRRALTFLYDGGGSEHCPQRSQDRLD